MSFFFNFLVEQLGFVTLFNLYKFSVYFSVFQCVILPMFLILVDIFRKLRWSTNRLSEKYLIKNKSDIARKI